MPNPFFNFKQFSVFQANTAMKVGTDGVLLGTWADCQLAERILDIGTGTGLVALMLAQRSQATIDAVELDESACSDTRLNFSSCPWNHRMKLYHTSIQNFSKDKKPTYHLIVCNPPYFINSLKTPEKSRNLARHNDELPVDELFSCVAKLLLPGGDFSIIIPTNQLLEYELQANKVNLRMYHKTSIKPTPDAQPKRILVSFKFIPIDKCVEDDLIVEKYGRHQYSEEFIKLTRDFYLA
jgi:tRNA1Val (adenine37-N6)-methyltransferase